MSNGLENPPTRAPVQGLLVLDAHHRHEEIGREQQESSAKLRRSHADNRVRLLVHFRPASHHARDRKSTRLNSSHLGISYAVFCLKKKKKDTNNHMMVTHEQTTTS